MSARVRMVRCVYSNDEEGEWVPMGRARTRCPRCGAKVESSGAAFRRNQYHVEQLREPDE